jgi:integrase
METNLEAVNGRLSKGEGWIGYRFTKDADGNKKPSKFLYVSFYRNGQQVWVNSKTNEPEEAYRQLLDARGATSRGTMVLPNEAARITYQHLRASYIGDKPIREKAHQLQHIDGYFGRLKALDITTDTIRKYITHRRTQVADPTIRRELVVLRAMFKLAAREKALSHDQIPYFPMPADSEAAGQYIEPQEFHAIRAHLPDGTLRESNNGGPKSKSNLQSFFMFLYATGCRLGAAQKITWKDVDKDCTMISIPASGTKNKQPLRLPLKGELLEPLARDLRKTKFRVEDQPIFDSTNYRPEWAKACAKANMGTWDKEKRIRTGARIHDCRASAAINLLASGVDEGLVLKIGGWKTRSMLDRYNVTNVTRLTDAMTKGGQFVNALMKKAQNG